MFRLIKGILIISATMLCSCTYGLLYTSKVSPYTLNMNSTPRGINNPVESTKVISIPTTGLSAAWDDRAIGSAAKAAGLNEIYYADLYTYSILAGLWSQQYIRVYGK